MPGQRYPILGASAVAAVLLLSSLAVGATTQAHPVGATTEVASSELAWGIGGGGQLGDGTTTASRSTPVPVRLPAGVSPTALAGGADASYAIGSDGHLYAWGSGSNGELGNGATTPSQTTPVQVALPTGVTPTAIASGQSTGYAIGSDGHLYAWGFGAEGGLGNGTTTTVQAMPVEVSLPAGVTPTAVAAGYSTGYAIGSDGHLYAWGNAGNGELGDGTTEGFVTTPVEVSLPVGVAPTAVAAGLFSGYAVGSDGILYAWGAGGYGELGDGTTTDSPTPVDVSLPAGVTPTAVAGGGYTGYAIGSDGSLFAWGLGSSGQLGNGTAPPSQATPVDVAMPSGVGTSAVSAGVVTGYAVGSDGHLYAWGGGGDGELGDGTTASSEVPVQVSLPAGTAPVAVGAEDASQTGSVEVRETATVAFTSPTEAVGRVGKALRLRPTATSSSGSPTSVTAASGLPPWMTFSPSARPGRAGSLRGHVPAGVTGPISIVLSASDAAGDNGAQILTVDIPRITSSPTASFTVGEAGSFDVTVSDVPPGATVTLTTPPDGLSTSSDGSGGFLISGTPAVIKKSRTYNVTAAVDGAPVNGVSRTLVKQKLRLTVDLPAP